MAGAPRSGPWERCAKQPPHSVGEVQFQTDTNLVCGLGLENFTIN